MFLNYKVQGEGEPLILIHGLFGSLDNLGGLAKVLAQHYRVYQVDLPNHGQSFHHSEVGYEKQSDSVFKLIEHLELDSVTLVGHSMGGKVAMALSQRFPDYVSRLVVMDMAPVNYQVRRHDNVFAGLQQSRDSVLTSRKEAEAALALHIQDPGVRQFLLKSLYRLEDGTYSWRFNVDNLLNGYTDITGWPLSGSYSGPSLFLKGQLSDYISPEHRTEIENQFPAAKAHVVANTGHWLHAEKPETVARVIVNFLTKAGR